MCGRYTLTAPVDAIARLFQVAERPNLQPRWNVAPTQDMPVVTIAPDDRHLQIKRWGFESSHGLLINARSETVTSRPTFRSAFQNARCLVPADSFYEWQALAEGGKQAWRIGLRGGGLFAFAGLWQDDRFTILTTAANDYLAPIHERMPVILPSDVWPIWLSGPATEAQKLLRPLPSEGMARYRVGVTVNNVRNDTETCAAPLNPALRRGDAG